MNLKNQPNCNLISPLLITKKYADDLNLCTINLCHGSILLDQKTRQARLVESLLVSPLANIDHRANCTIHLELKKPQFVKSQKNENFHNTENDTYAQISKFMEAEVMENVRTDQGYSNITTTEKSLRRKQKKSFWNEEATRLAGVNGLDNISKHF